VQAKVWHPIRWLITTYLVSWEPAATTDEARARYNAWRAAPHWWVRSTKPATPDRPSNPPQPPVAVTASTSADGQPGQETPQRLAPVRPITSGQRRRAAGNGGKPSIEELARYLDHHFRDRTPGRPTAQAALKEHFGTCSVDRADEAKNLLARWRSGRQPTQTDTPETDDDKERDRDPFLVTA
jgi:hypothetical protein